MRVLFPSRRLSPLILRPDFRDDQRNLSPHWLFHLCETREPT
jgi:hypothetical protein